MSNLHSQFARWLSERAPSRPPDDLLPRAFAMIREVPQERRNEAPVWIGRFAGMGAIGLAIVVGLALASGRLELIGAAPSDTPMPSPTASSGSATPSATPNATPSAAPSPSPVAGWLKGPTTCADPELRFSVSVPAGWHANEQDGELAPCRLFNPDALVIDNPADPPSVAIRLHLVAAGSEFGFITETEVVDERTLTIDGLPARRYLTETLGLNGQQVYYIIGIEGSMPSDANRVSFITISTHTFYGDPSAPGDIEAIDQIATDFMLER